MAARDFKFTYVDRNGEPVLQKLEKASATVIEEGDMVALSSGLAVKADETSTAIAYAAAPAASGDTSVLVINDEDAVYEGAADANLADSNRGTEVDLVVSGSTQKIDLGSSSTDVFKVMPGEEAGTAGQSASVYVKINKTL